MPFTFDDLEIFGLEPPIDKGDVRRAYRRLLIQNHPDLGGDSDSMARINGARDRLLASLEPVLPPPAEPRRRTAPATMLDEIDSPSLFGYLVWMVLAPTALLTLLFAVLSMVS